MIRIYCKPSQIAEYIAHYAQRQAPWDRFWGVLRLDFEPSFLEKNLKKIKQVYEFKVDLKKELTETKYNRVAA